MQLVSPEDVSRSGGVRAADHVHADVADVVDLVALDKVVRAVAENAIVGLICDARLAEIPLQDIVAERIVIRPAIEADDLALFTVVREIPDRKALEGIVVAADDHAAKHGVGGRKDGAGRAVRRTQGKIVLGQHQILCVRAGSHVDRRAVGRDVDPILNLARGRHIDAVRIADKRVGHRGI